jgi:purine-binding chemotaxis protein CheW
MPIEPQHEERGADRAQYLTFTLAGEEYGLEIGKIQEIRGWTPPTQIPNTPRFVVGVINLRGTIVPIIDLRLRFDLEPLDYGPTTVVIVLQVRGEARERTMAIVVDAVSDVHDLSPSERKPPPDFGCSANLEYVQGLGTLGEKMLILLDTDRLLNSGELREDVVEESAQEVEGQEGV